MASSVYYAHSMKIYGTDREREEFAFLQKKFGQVCNPNGDISPCGSLAPYLLQVKTSSQVVFSLYQGHVGKGVFEEIMMAFSERIPVFCLRKRLWSYSLRKVKKIRIVDQHDWKIKYGKIDTYA